MSSKIPQKTQDPEDYLDWTLDHAAWLKSGDAIATSEWEIFSPDGVVPLLKAGESHTDTTTTVWLLSGQANVQYTVTNHFTTIQGRHKDRSLYMQIVDQ